MPEADRVALEARRVTPLADSDRIVAVIAANSMFATLTYAFLGAMFM